MHWTRGYLIILAVLAVLLGHDALMAADPHRAAVDHIMSLAEAHAMPDSEARGASFASVASGSTLRSVCPAPDTAHTSPHTLPIEGPLVAGVVPATTMWLASPMQVSVANLASPGHPPATRRALLQVYLN